MHICAPTQLGNHTRQGSGPDEASGYALRRQQLSVRTSLRSTTRRIGGEGGGFELYPGVDFKGLTAVSISENPPNPMLRRVEPPNRPQRKERLTGIRGASAVAVERREVMLPGHDVLVAVRVGVNAGPKPSDPDTVSAPASQQTRACATPSRLCDALPSFLLGPAQCRQNLRRQRPRGRLWRAIEREHEIGSLKRELRQRQPMLFGLGLDEPAGARQYGASISPRVSLCWGSARLRRPAGGLVPDLGPGHRQRHCPMTGPPLNYKRLRSRPTSSNARRASMAPSSSPTRPWNTSSCFGP